MTTHVQIRQANGTDAAELAALRWRFKQEDHDGQPPSRPRDVREAETWIRTRLDAGHWLAWVAEDDGRICGQVFLNLVERVPDPYGDNNPLGYVTNFYVVPTHRNRGIGGRLLDALHRYATKHTLDTLIVWPSERSAVLYGRTGYRIPTELLERRGEAG